MENIVTHNPYSFGEKISKNSGKLKRAIKVEKILNKNDNTTFLFSFLVRFITYCFFYQTINAILMINFRYPTKIRNKVIIEV